MGVAYTQLIPIQELTPGQVGAIRNQVINNLVAQVSRELSLPEDKLVVRDIRPFHDLAMYGVAATTLTFDEWAYTATTDVADTWRTVTGAGTMGDQRYVALFGIRDLRLGLGLHATATAEVYPAVLSLDVIQVKINVGGADKVIWDLQNMEAYRDNLVGFSPSAIILPQNVSFNIYYMRVNTATEMKSKVQLIGVVCEPRGKLVSP